MTENELSKIIVDAVYQIHVRLGPGLLESVYEEVLSYELSQRDLRLSRQHHIPVVWKNVKLDQGFRADLIVENKVLKEVKSVEGIIPVFPKQVLTYLKLTNLKL